MSHILIRANSLRIPLADRSVQCVVTSPPYWGLRDYGVEGQLGLEPTPDEFVANMVAVFREVRRVLRDDGTCFMNLGDSYAGNLGGNRNGHDNTTWENAACEKERSNHIGTTAPRAGPKTYGLKPKDLIGIPWRVALALQADGWYLRSDIIWAKPNPMPESVTDRPTKSHEYVFLLTKSERYYWDAEAVREAEKEPGRSEKEIERQIKLRNGELRKPAQVSDSIGTWRGDGSSYQGGRNIRTVWNIPTESYPGSHFATFPRKLVEPCVKAGTSQKGCCPECGKGWEREADRQSMSEYRPMETGRLKQEASAGMARTTPQGRTCGTVAVKTTGWHPTCQHGHAPVPCTVFDPFTGSGTTGVVAEGLHRRFVGTDLSREYLGMARNRIERPHKPILRPGRHEVYPLFREES